MRYPFHKLLTFKVLHLCLFNLMNLLRSELCAYYFPFQILLKVVGHDDGRLLGCWCTARDTPLDNGRFRPDRCFCVPTPTSLGASMTAEILRVFAQYGHFSKTFRFAF